MWLYTKYGHYSVVLDKDNRSRLAVRARRVEDLNTLREKYMPSLTANWFSPNRDYPVRGFISHAEFAKAMFQMALDLDYSDFKGMIYRTDAKRYDVYTNVHHAAQALETCHAQKPKIINKVDFANPARAKAPVKSVAQLIDNYDYADDADDAAYVQSMHEFARGVEKLGREVKMNVKTPTKKRDRSNRRKR